jgi:hypothetical protein
VAHVKDKQHHTDNLRRAPHSPMGELNHEQTRALRLLARSPNGRTTAVLMAYGFPIEMLEELVSSGNARAEAHRTTSAGRPVTVVWLQISAAGRKVIAE